MKGIEITAPPDRADEVFYPTSDGEPMAETEAHLMLMVHLIATLRQYYAQRPDVYVIGNMYFYYLQGHPEARKAPDIMVIKGVDPKLTRLSFKTWEEKAWPCAIIELTSPGTAKEDQEEKKLLYQQLGIREYFLFDPLDESLPRQLIGYRLIGHEYEELIPGGDGGVLSAELGVRLVPQGMQLALVHFGTGQRLLAPPDAYKLVDELKKRTLAAEGENKRLREEARQADEKARQADEKARQSTEQARQAEQQARQAEQQARQAEQQARREQERAALAEQQLEEMRAELARLRAAFQPPPSTGETPGP